MSGNSGKTTAALTTKVSMDNRPVDGNGYNKLNANGTFTFVEGKIGMYTLRVLNTLQLFM